ncbi:hypothetical protein LWI29_023141 [Acer saccharum]|uniref:Uncharacterized protein n=1 Tax=Acer saccharum TaxID=4024 RepID=A0AA39RLE4_ACESA|nr:hypothetical protein LWI29_023141 [Acer saccharum]
MSASTPHQYGSLPVSYLQAAQPQQAMSSHQFESARPSYQSESVMPLNQLESAAPLTIPIQTRQPRLSTKSPAVPFHIDIPVPKSVTCSQPSNSHHMITRLKSGTLPHKAFSSICKNNSSPAIDTEPRTAADALKIPHWKAAMLDEYSALMRNQTWTLVPPNESTNLVGCDHVTIFYCSKQSRNDPDQHQTTAAQLKSIKEAIIIKGLDCIWKISDDKASRRVEDGLGGKFCYNCNRIDRWQSYPKPYQFNPLPLV